MKKITGFFLLCLLVSLSPVFAAFAADGIVASIPVTTSPLPAPGKSVAISDIAVNTGAITRGKTIAYSANFTPIKDLGAGYIAFSIKNAAGLVVGTQNLKFDSIPAAKPYHAGSQFTVPTTLADGSYSIEATVYVGNAGAGSKLSKDVFQVKSSITGICGPAAGAQTDILPSAGLCKEGTAGTVGRKIADNSWNWLCVGSDNRFVFCTAPGRTVDNNVGCGSANGSGFTETPTANLCQSGATASGVAFSSGSYNWLCFDKTGSASAICSATKLVVVNGACGAVNGVPMTMVPPVNLCLTGTASAVATGPASYAWTCTGYNGGTTAACASPRIVPVNAACGSASGVGSVSAPAANLCASGTAGAVATGDSAFGWNCNGLNGGTSTSCYAPKLNPVTGACGSASGMRADAAPTANLCTTGKASAVTSGTYAFNWTCGGSNGGVNETCAAYKQVTLNNKPFLLGVNGGKVAATAEIPTVINRMTALGLSEFRVGFNWDQYQSVILPSLKTPEFAKDTRIQVLESAKASGLRPLIIFAYDNHLYDNGGYPVSAVAQQAYADYAASAVGMTRKYNAIYQVYNEWNWGTGMAGKDKSVATVGNYMSLLKGTYKSIKANAPDALVIPSSFVGDGWTASDDLLKAGVLDYADGFSVNIYNHCKQAQYRTSTDMLASLETLQDHIKTITGKVDYPVYITEFGWPTASGSKCLVTPQQSASNFVDFLLTATKYPWLKAAWIYGLQDLGTDTVDLEQNFGLYKADGSGKPSVDAVSGVSRLIKDASFFAIASPWPGTKDLTLTKGNKVIHALWQQPDSAVKYRIKVTKGEGTSHRISKIASADPVAFDTSLPLDQMPIIVEYDRGDKFGYQISVANDAACGTANGVATVAAPTSGLCATGAASGMAGSTAGFSWTCAGVNGGANAACAAPKPAAVNGACGAANGVGVLAAPATGLCATGAASAVAAGANSFTWNCAGANAGTTASCAAPKLVPVSGVCGAASGMRADTAPTTGLCATGTASTVASGTYSFTWTCGGSNGGANGSCAAYKQISLDSKPYLLGIAGKRVSATGEIPGAVGKMTALGLSEYRVDMNWDQYQLGILPSLQNPAVAKNLLVQTLEASKSGGLRPLVIFGYNNHLYDNGGYPVSDEAQKAYADYAASAVGMTRQYNAIYQMYNEWNWGTGMTGKDKSVATAENYVKLARKSYQAIKAVAPESLVIPSSFVSAAGDWAASDDLLKAGVLNYADGFSVNIYNACKTAKLRTSTDMFTRLEDLQAHIKTITGKSDYPIYITEFGWPTAASGGCVVTPQQSANNFADFLLTATKYPWLKAAWMYSLQDTGTDPVDLEQNFGHYKADGSDKPSVCVVSDLSRILKGASFFAMSSPWPGTKDLTLTKGDKVIHALWQQPDSDVNYSISLAKTGGDSHRISKICSGSPVAFDTPLKLDQMPIIVEYDRGDKFGYQIGIAKDAACGTANGVATVAAPTSALCATGTASGMASGTGNFTWTCTGVTGGANASCAAPKLVPVNGVCGSANGVGSVATPAGSLCATGTASAVAAGANSFTWSCAGSNTGTNASCAAPKLVPVNGTCGSANGTSGVNAPNGNLCATGTAGAVSTGGNSFSWTCAGANTGKHASCTATRLIPVNGVCGAANNVASLTAPASALCTTGTASTVATGANGFTWSCAGANTGTNASCAAPKLIPVTGACGTASGTSVTDTPAQGLCTTGTASAVVSANYSYTWSCAGANTGANATCAAYKQITPNAQPYVLGVATHNRAADTVNIMNTLSRIGMSEFREDFSWSGYQSWTKTALADGNRQKIPAVTQLDMAKANGMRPLLIFGYGNANYDKGGYPVSDEAQAAYAAFAANAVTDTRKFNPMYQIWNEWNWGTGMAGQDKSVATAANFVKLQKKSYQAIKAVAPDALVIPSSFVSSNLLDASDDLLKAGVLDYADGFSINLYNHCKAAQNRTSGDLLGSLETLQAHIKTITGKSDYPIYITEFGWPTAAGSPCKLTQQESANNFADFLLSATKYPWLKAAWIYDLRDDGTDPANLEHNFGVTANDYSDKAATCVVSDVNKLINGASYFAMSSPWPGTKDLTLTKGNKVIHAIWQQPGSNVNYSISLAKTGGDSHRISKICSGSPVAFDTPLKLDQMPIIVEYDRGDKFGYQIGIAKDAACGTANGVKSLTAPASGLCATGTATAVATGADSFTWTCTGVTGGANASCAAPKMVNGACGAANGVGAAAAPAAGLCATGTASAVTTAANGYAWSCAGTNGGTNATCAAPVLARTYKLASYTYGGPDAIKDVQKFDAWLGRKTDLYVTNLNQNSWLDALQSVSWLTSPSYYPTDRRMVIGVPITTAKDSGGSFWANDVSYTNTNLPKGTLKQAADGVFDAQYKAIATALIKYGRGNAIIRVGWEMNGNWQPWRAAADPENFKKAFQRVVTVFRATPGASFEFDFNPNFGKQEINPELVYPGDAYVDYIGQDVYDNTWSASDKDPVARWNAYYNGANGIKWLVDFANAHGKKKSFPEFGAGGGYSAPGVGDSAYFITKMAEVIKTNNFAYAGYWDSDEAYAGEISTNHYPQIGAEFIKQFK